MFALVYHLEDNKDGINVFVEADRFGHDSGCEAIENQIQSKETNTSILGSTSYIQMIKKYR